MGTRLEMAAQEPRTGTRQGKGGDARKEAAKAPRNAPASPGRCLLSQADVETAIAWRLDGLSAAEVVTLADALRPFATDLRESLPAVAQVLADLRRPGDRRGAWSLAAAVLARDAQRRGDVVEFILAGVAVIESMRRSMSNSGKQRSPLKPRMRQFKVSHPELLPSQAFDAFARGCDPDIRHVVADDSLRIDGWPLLSRESFCRAYRQL